MTDAPHRSGRFGALLGTAAFVAALARAAAIHHVFTEGRVYPGGPDGYYHLRRALLILQDWPNVAQFDRWLNAPQGGLISWPPLFDFLLAALALPWRVAPHAALEIIGALLPAILGVLQVFVAAAVARRVWNERAAVVAAFLTALLPGVVRYTMIGALDHDPLFETAVLLSMLAIAIELRRDIDAASGRSIALLAVSLATGVLAWTGAVVQMAIVFCAAATAIVASPSSRVRIARLVAGASFAAAAIVAPFAFASIWTHRLGATFEGLSLLHVAVLAGMALVASIAALAGGQRDKGSLIIGVLSFAASLYLVPLSVVPFVRGTLYAAGQATILHSVAEAQPLFFLFGPFDLRPALVRLTLLPFAGAVIVLLHAWRTRDARAAATLAWFFVTLALALSHSRFSYSAALAGAIISALAVELLVAQYGGRRAATAAFAMLSPLLVAYIPVSGFREFTLTTRTNELRTSGLEELLPQLRSRQGVVVAPWYLGHWILWLADRPVAMSPMLSVGQDAFASTLRMYFITEPEGLLAELDARDARWLIVTSAPGSLMQERTMAGLPPEPLISARGIDVRAYLDTVAGRLAVAGNRAIGVGERRYDAIPRLVERGQSAITVPTPFGPQPLLRLFEVLPDQPR